MNRIRRLFPALLMTLVTYAGAARAGVVVGDPDAPIQDLPGNRALAAPGAVVDGHWHLLLDPSDNPGEPTPPPLPRFLHTAILDAGNNRMIVFGGLLSGVALDDVWAMDLSGPGHAWSQLSPVGTMGGRRDHTSIYDPVRHRMVVFGGSLGTDSFFNDVWQLTLNGTPTWSPVVTTGTPPTGRFSHTALYDPVRDRMLVFGGYNGAFLNDTWQLDFTTSPATWSQIVVGGAPPVRDAMTAAYDPIGDRMLVFGGFGPGVFRGDLWALSLSGTPAWTQLTQTGTVPSERRHYSAAVDPTRNRLIISGGLKFAPDNVNVQYLDDTYALSFSTMSWSQINITGPVRRDAHRAVYSPVLDEFVEFGGFTDLYGYINDSWRIVNPASPSWQEIIPGVGGSSDAPSARRDHSAVIDNANNMVIFGGWDGNFLNDVWKLGLDGPPVWTQVTPSGTPPPARFAHTSLWDPANNRMLVFGGFNGAFLNDLWQLSFTGTPTWTELHPAGGPPAIRNAMTAIYDPSHRRFVVFGGYDGNNFLDDVWALNLDGPPVWSDISSPHGQSPTARRHYAAIYDPDRNGMVISGGLDLTLAYRDDSWLFDFDKDKWKRLNAGKDLASPRNAHRAVYDPGRHAMIMFGGYGGSNTSPTYLNDSWSLLLDHTRWNKLLPTGDLPSPRLLHTAIFDAPHDRLLLFGGLDGNVELNDLWALEFSAPAAAQKPSIMASGQLPNRVEFALKGSYPNPASGPFRVDFSLPSSEPASLSIYTVTGRRVAARDVGGLGMGRHVVQFTNPFTPGIYWVRLTQAGKTRTTKAAIMR